MAVKRSSTHAMTKRRETQAELVHKRELEIEKKCYKYGAIVIAVIAVIVVLNIFDLLPHLNGSLHYYNGTVRGVSDSDIIACTDSDAHRYYKIASFTVPEGYTNDSENSVSSSSDANINSWAIKSDSDPYLKYTYITGVGKSWDEMYSTIYQYYTLSDDEGNVVAVPTEYSGTTESGLKYHAMVAPAQEDTYNDDYQKFATCYVETSHNCSVLVMSFVEGATEDDFPSDEVFMSYIYDALKGLTIK